MKKLAISLLAAAALATPALAADVKLPTKAALPPDPWDVAFGGALASDYIFRGITQSNRGPSVSAYFEPRYNVIKDVQLYAGISGSSISFPNRAALEVDLYGGVRPTFGPLALDLGFIYYWYPRGQCFNGSTAPVFGTDCLANGYLPVNGNVIKADLSFLEIYAKAIYTVNEHIAFGAAVYYSDSGAQFRRRGHLRGRHREAYGTQQHAPVRLRALHVGRSWLLEPGEPATSSTAPRSVRRHVPRRFRTGSPTPATPPGTSEWELPRACSRSTCAITIPI